MRHGGSKRVATFMVTGASRVLQGELEVESAVISMDSTKFTVSNTKTMPSSRVLQGSSVTCI